MPTLFHRYNEILRKYPFRSNMITTGIFFGLGDFFAQKLFPHKTIHKEVNDKGEIVETEQVTAMCLIVLLEH